MSEIRCLECGRNQVTKVERSLVLTEPYADPVTISFEGYECDDCGAEFADDTSYESALAQGKRKLRKSALINIVDDLVEMGYNVRSIEFAMQLPYRTISRWKNDPSINPSAAGLAMMRYLRTYPWLIKVGQEKYNPHAVKETLLQAAQVIISKELEGLGQQSKVEGE